MGWKYTVQVWGRHCDDPRIYAYRVHWGGQSLLKALIELWRASRLGYGCVTLECR